MWLLGDLAKDAPVWWHEQELITTTTSFSHSLLQFHIKFNVGNKSKIGTQQMLSLSPD